MDNHIQLSFFYGKEADQYSFYKIPKLLFKDPYYKNLSTDAKVLYGLMLDRISLSVKNKWMDSRGRAYIFYSIEEIMEDINCKNNKATSIMKELDVGTGIGLIERKRQGQGKPTIIYVMQFVINRAQKWEKPMSEENRDVSEMGNSNVLTLENHMSRNGKNQSPDMGFSHANKNNINNTELINTESNLISSSDPNTVRLDMDAYRKIIENQLEMHILMERYPFEHELLQGIMDLILEINLCDTEYVTISGAKYPIELVRSKFRILNCSHIEYAIECFSKNTTKVHNIKKYLLAILFNAPSTISGYYKAEVAHDFPQFVKCK